jgi:aminopeptidase N
MMKLILVIFLMLTIMTVLNAQTNQSADPQPGVPRELAIWRAAHYSDVHYTMGLKLVPGAQMLKGVLDIRVKLDTEADKIILDWRMNPVKEGQPKPRVWDIMLNNKQASGAREVNEHLIIPGAVKGENFIQLRFESPIATSGSAVTRYLDREDKSEYIYTLFVPSDASTAFPCFDQPDLKARFALDLNAPQDWNVVSNTPVVMYGNPLPGNASKDEDEIQPGTRTAHFQPTEPISTYLFAFAAGPFVKIEEHAFETRDASAYPQRKEDKPENYVDDGIAPMEIYVRKSKVKQAYKEAAEVFRLNHACLNFLAKYFDYKFPFEKYDLVIIPEFAYRGMEHAGATFLREESILFPTEPTANDFLSRANVMFHEAAHQWFGDLVTMRWFDDLWLKEGFAEFMSFKALEAIMPEFNAWKAFYERTKPAAYLTDATKGTTPIFQEIPNLSAAKSAYGNIVYRKAPSMLRQAEFYLGADKFQQALRLYLKEHAYANASWSDLVRDFEKSSGRKLDAWADAWVKRRGMPEVDVRVNLMLPAKFLLYASLTQRNVLDEAGAWPMRVKVLAVFTDGTRQIETVTLEGDGEPKGVQINLAKPKRELAYVFANYEDYGYGRFLLDEQSRAYVLAHLGEEKDDFLRALLWGSLWDSVREAELPPSDYIELAIKNLSVERDEVTVQGILNRVSTAFNAYLSREQAKAIAPRLEQMLSDGMMKSEKQGLRITYFRAFQAMAMTDEARATLKKILKGSQAVPGLQLRSRDRFDIITALMARGDADAPALLEAQSKLDTTDDAKRYAYAAGAALATAENKKKYFDAYLNDPQLAESWIEASVAPFNSIHQSALTLPFLEAALKALPQLKRTRKIFFVNGWLAAFIGGQCDERALTIVQDFLKREEKTLDRDLRLKVLEAVDGLERCVKIRKSQVSSPKTQVSKLKP